MASELDWQTRQRTARDAPTDGPFSGRRTIEDTDGVDPATFDDMSEASYEFPEIPGYVKTIGVAAGAVVAGMAVGYWLGGRRARRRRMAMPFADVDVADFMKLAPEAAHLLKNPVVRAFLAKLAARQMRGWLDKVA